MKRIKVAQIGNEHDHAYWNFLAMRNHPEIFDIAGMVLTSEKDAGVYSCVPILSLDEVLAKDDLDAVIIESGKENEVVHAQLFADRGIPVFLDKPGSADIPRFETFIRTMEKKNLPFGLGYMYRFNPVVTEALAICKRGELGEIFSVEAQMSIELDGQKREWLGRYKGGMLYYLGCHLTDLVCQFQGFPERILPLSGSTYSDGIDTEDFGFAVFQYKNGASFVKTCASEVNGFDRRQLVVCGTKGTIEIRPLEKIISGDEMKAQAKITLLGEKSKIMETGQYNRYFPMLEQFAAQVRGEAGLVMPYEYELTLLKTIVRACGAKCSVYRGNIKDV